MSAVEVIQLVGVAITSGFLVVTVAQLRKCPSQRAERSRRGRHRGVQMRGR